MKKHQIALAVAVAVAAALLMERPAQAANTKAEIKCQLATGLSVGKFVGKKTKCVAKCQHRAFSDASVAPDCVPPYGGPTFACATKTEGKYSAAIQAGCAKDCPECYTGGDCTVDSQARIAGAESHVEALADDVFCDDSASPDGLTLAEHKCQLTVAKFVSQLAAKKLMYYGRCYKAEAAGRIAAGSCTPPATDAKTAKAVEKLEQKVAFLIDKKCEASVNPSADKPECGVYPTRDGAAWAAAEEASVDAMYGGLFCADP